MADQVMRRMLFVRHDSREMLNNETNDTMVDKLISSNSLKTEACIDAFRHVDRHHFWVNGNSELAYADMPLRSGRLHLSAPHIYARALESLMPLRPGMSFLNIGSGTGYFNSIIADLTGNLAVNHGIDVWPETVAHAQERCAILDKDHIEFTTGNIYQLDVSKTIRYDRVYVGACANSRSKYLYRLLEVGGVLIGPFQTGHSQQLRRVVRTTETHFHVEVLGSVQFATLIEPPAEEFPALSEMSEMDFTTTEVTEGTTSAPATPSQLSRRASVMTSTTSLEDGGRRDSVGLPGVPFTFALCERPWTPERCGTYPHSFKKTVVMGLLCRPKDPTMATLPTEIWMKHIFPWCPRWWFETKATRASPKLGPLLAPPVATCALALPDADMRAKTDADACDEFSDEGTSTNAPSTAVQSAETTPESRPTSSPILQPTEMDAGDISPDEEDDDVLFEVFDNGQRHAIGTEGDPDDMEPDDGHAMVPLHLLQLLEANAELENGRIAMWAAIEARRRLGMMARSDSDSDIEDEDEEEEMDDAVEADGGDADV
mmetsp:Transcript_29832/g.65736  ORF Transcript_29832/g.65736 Transcript_29832/m.65736 type:complete len:544 (+) Transcript_29832:111-1742(+)